MLFVFGQCKFNVKLQIANLCELLGVNAKRQFLDDCCVCHLKYPGQQPNFPPFLMSKTNTSNGDDLVGALTQQVYKLTAERQALLLSNKNLQEKVDRVSNTEMLEEKLKIAEHITQQFLTKGITSSVNAHLERLGGTIAKNFQHSDSLSQWKNITWKEPKYSCSQYQGQLISLKPKSYNNEVAFLKELKLCQFEIIAHGENLLVFCFHHDVNVPDFTIYVALLQKQSTEWHKMKLSHFLSTLRRPLVDID